MSKQKLISGDEVDCFEGDRDDHPSMGRASVTSRVKQRARRRERRQGRDELRAALRTRDFLAV